MFEGVAETARRGLWLWRGIKTPGAQPSDPGDLGAGTYWSTRRSRARCYGKLTRQQHRFEHPLIMSFAEAYDFAERFGALCNGLAEQQQRALAMRAWLKAQGHDALIAVRERRARQPRRTYTELEVVDLR